MLFRNIRSNTGQTLPTVPGVEWGSMLFIGTLYTPTVKESCAFIQWQIMLTEKTIQQERRYRWGRCVFVSHPWPKLWLINTVTDCLVIQKWQHTAALYKAQRVASSTLSATPSCWRGGLSLIYLSVLKKGNVRLPWLYLPGRLHHSS